MFVSYFYKAENNWGYGNAQVNKSISNINDIIEIEQTILKSIKEKYNNVDEVKILSFQKFF